MAPECPIRPLASWRQDRDSSGRYRFRCWRGANSMNRIGRGRRPVAIVNEAWAKVNLDGRNPVGQRVVSFGLRMKPQEMEIIGLAKNTRYDELAGDFPAVVYMPFEQYLGVPVDEMTFFLRTAGDP